MRRVMAACVLLAGGILCIPMNARAEVYTNPWAGVHFDNPQLAKGFHSVGVAIGNAGGDILGTETHIAWSPKFFDGDLDNYELDFMAGLTLGPTFNTSGKRIRPYFVGEVGMIRTSIESATIGGRFARTDFGFATGAGVTQDLSDSLGVRVDFRYLRSLNGDDADNSLNATLGNLHFWRLAIGVVFH